jgi:outer membrane protein TolC
MLQRSIALFTILALAASTAPAQFSVFPDKTYWKEMWQAPPSAVEIEAVSKLEDYVVDGKVQLSLKAYGELVMANSPDINLQKLSVYEGQNAIARALSPFDPTFTASFNANRSTTPSNDVLAGADIRSNLSQNGRATYNQIFDTGTEFQTSYTTNRSSNNSSFTTFNPSITQGVQIQLTQPLLRGRGRDIQRLPFLIAESRLDQTAAQVRQQIIQLLFQAESAYWDVISQRENLQVRENNLELARAFLERSRRELELGAISPLDIYQPEQQFATSQVGVTQARYRLQQAEDAVRRWIAADLHPDIRNLPLALTESAEPPTAPPTFDAEQLVEVAMGLRPEMQQRRQSLEIDDLSIKQATNRLRPDLSLNGLYSSTGRGGNFFDRSLTGDGGAVTVVPGGLGDALSQLFGFSIPTYQVGLTLQLPLRNRRAAADLADASIQKKRDLFQLRSVEQDIRLDVLQAVAGVELSKAAVQQAAVAQDFAQKRLDAEQRKYDLGVTTAFIVLDAQDTLVQAEADLIDQAIAYRRALLTLDRATGELLQKRGIELRYD